MKNYYKRKNLLHYLINRFEEKENDQYYVNFPNSGIAENVLNSKNIENSVQQNISKF